MTASEAALKRDERFTYADYKNWELAPGERYELIDGVAYAMAAPSRYHQEISMALSWRIGAFLHGKPCRVYAAPFDVRLFYAEDESDNTVVQPDLAVICDKKKLGDEGGRGAPELVIEIMSPSNTADEVQRKFAKYRHAGVREYWEIYPEEKSVRVYLFDGMKIEMRICGIGDELTTDILPGLSIPVAEIFAE
jgi:Uma2 family endonuclease